jgi:hypothetical protein
MFTTTLSSSLSPVIVLAVTEPDPETVADAVREQERADRDEEVATDLKNTDRVARELADDED